MPARLSVRMSHVALPHVLEVANPSARQPMLPTRPGQPARRSHDYKRHGTTSLFAALDIATGRVIGKCYACHRAIEFRIPRRDRGRCECPHMPPAAMRDLGFEKVCTV